MKIMGENLIVAEAVQNEGKKGFMRIRERDNVVRADGSKSKGSLIIKFFFEKLPEGIKAGDTIHVDYATLDMFTRHEYKGKWYEEIISNDPVVRKVEAGA